MAVDVGRSVRLVGRGILPIMAPNVAPSNYQSLGLASRRKPQPVTDVENPTRCCGREEDSSSGCFSFSRFEIARG